MWTLFLCCLLQTINSNSGVYLLFHRAVKCPGCDNMYILNTLCKDVAFILYVNENNKLLKIQNADKHITLEMYLKLHKI